MTDTSPNRVGQINGAGSATALFLPIFSGEVLLAYQNAAKVRPLIRTRTITRGESARFGAMGNATAKRHVPGEDILDPANAYLSGIPFGRQIINADAKLLSAEFVDDVDELMNAFEVRGPIATKLGTALALQDDAELLQLVAIGARRTSGPTSDHGIGRVIMDATVDTDISVLKKAIRETAIAMDEANVSEDGRIFALRPREYHRLVLDNDFVSKDFVNGANADRARGVIMMAEGFMLLKTNQIPSTSISSTLTDGTRNEYGGDFSDTVALAFQSEALGAVMLRGVVTEVERSVRHQGTLLTSHMVNGKNVLRETSCYEVSKDNPGTTSLTNVLDLSTV